MKILVLGGTGAMGRPLVDVLEKNPANQIYVTTRSDIQSTGRVMYIQGDAKESNFFASLMEKEYDAIVDFMVYRTEEFRERISILLEQTKQYFFFSSSRCYAKSDVPITETSPRLVDVCRDEAYLSTDEYGLAKGREENLLMESGRTNWTIVRPYITYNSYRIQLGVYEKENWLRRALAGRTIVFPKDIADRRTSLTYGPDVACAVAELIGNENAYGEAFHITSAESHTWGEILEFYCEIIEKKTGKRPKVKLVENSMGLQNVWNPWQIKYDRCYDRIFDNSKIESILGRNNYYPTLQGLEDCLSEFLDNPRWLDMDWRYEAWCDCQTREITPIHEICGLKSKLKYVKWRFLRG